MLKWIKHEQHSNRPTAHTYSRRSRRCFFFVVYNNNNRMVVTLYTSQWLSLKCIYIISNKSASLKWILYKYIYMGNGHHNGNNGEDIVRGGNETIQSLSTVLCKPFVYLYIKSLSNVCGRQQRNDNSDKTSFWSGDKRNSTTLSLLVILSARAVKQNYKKSDVFRCPILQSDEMCRILNCSRIYGLDLAIDTYT